MRSPRETRKIAEIARRYRKEGYEVARDVAVGEPDLYADIVVRKNGLTIAIDVRTSDSLRQTGESVLRLAKLAPTLPGHRFDLVLTNPRRKNAPKRVVHSNGQSRDA